MTQDEALDVTAIHSAAGLTAGLPVTTRPFRAPHFTVSDAGLVGSGNPARPGEVSLAHYGVLFLDELDEFRRTAIEALACAVKDESVNVRGVRMPARPYLVAAANPCPCGHAGTDRCHCGDERKAAYRKRLNAYREALNLVEVEI
jgi:magnesium chelatase family protein